MPLRRPVGAALGIWPEGLTQADVLTTDQSVPFGWRSLSLISRDVISDRSHAVINSATASTWTDFRREHSQIVATRQPLWFNPAIASLSRVTLAANLVCQ